MHPNHQSNTPAPLHIAPPQVLLQRPLVPTAVLDALALKDFEREAFLQRLSHRDLWGDAEQRTLKHLLLKAEGSGAPAAQGLDWSKLQVGAD